MVSESQKMVLDGTLLNTQHYEVRIKNKVEQSRARCCPPLHLSVVAIEKGAFGMLLTEVVNFTYMVLSISI